MGFATLGEVQGELGKDVLGKSRDNEDQGVGQHFDLRLFGGVETCGFDG